MEEIYASIYLIPDSIDLDKNRIECYFKDEWWIVTGFKEKNYVIRRQNNNHLEHFVAEPLMISKFRVVPKPQEGDTCHDI